MPWRLCVASVAVLTVVTAFIETQPKARHIWWPVPVVMASTWCEKRDVDSKWAVALEWIFETWSYLRGIYMLLWSIRMMHCDYVPCLSAWHGASIATANIETRRIHSLNWPNKAWSRPALRPCPSTKLPTKTRFQFFYFLFFCFFFFRNWNWIPLPYFDVWWSVLF